MGRFIPLTMIVLVLFFASDASGGASVGGSKRQAAENVGALQAEDFPNDLHFTAPGEEISWLQILSVPHKSSGRQSRQTTMVFVPPTTLDRGDSSIQVEGFYIDPYEVTNIEYDLFLRATRREPPVTWPEGRMPEGQENEPVVGVTYDDAAAYARWAGKRLPTEAEWEVAATLAEKSQELANFKEGGEPGKMTNVAEWTSSPYDESGSRSRFKTIRRGEAAKCDRKIPLIDRAPMFEDDCNDFTGFRCVSDKPL